MSSASVNPTAPRPSLELCNDTPFTDAQLRQLDEELLNGRLPDFIRVRLL